MGGRESQGCVSITTAQVGNYGKAVAGQTQSLIIFCSRIRTHGFSQRTAAAEANFAEENATNRDHVTAAVHFNLAGSCANAKAGVTEGVYPGPRAIITTRNIHKVVDVSGIAGKHSPRATQAFGLNELPRSDVRSIPVSVVANKREGDDADKPIRGDCSKTLEDTELGELLGVVAHRQVDCRVIEARAGLVGAVVSVIRLRVREEVLGQTAGDVVDACLRTGPMALDSQRTAAVGGIGCTYEGHPVAAASGVVARR